MADFDPFDPKLNQSLKTDKKEEEQQESPDTFQFGEFALTPDAEDNQEVGGLTAGLAGITSGLIKIPEGFVSLGAEIMDATGITANAAARVEQAFDKINPFEEIAEQRAAGRLLEALVQVGVPAGIGAKIATKLATKALRAKRQGKYVNLKGKDLKKGMAKAGKLNELSGGQRFAAVVAGGAAGETFVADVEKIGSFGDAFEFGPTQLNRETDLDSQTDATRKLLNRFKFGTESLFTVPFVYGTFAGSKKLLKYGQQLAYSDSKVAKALDKVGGAFRPRGWKPKEVFLGKGKEQSRKMADLNFSMEQVARIDKEISKIFPDTKKFFNAASKEEKDLFLKQLDDLLFAGDLKNSITPKMASNIIKTMRKRGSSQESIDTVLRGLNNAREKMNELIGITAQAPGAKVDLPEGVTADLRKVMGDRVKNFIGNTYEIFDNQDYSSFFKYKPARSHIDNVKNIFKRYAAKNQNPITDQEAEDMVNEILKQARRINPKKDGLPTFRYENLTLGAKEPYAIKTFAQTLEKNLPKGEKQLKVIGKGSKAFRQLFGEIEDARHSIFEGINRLSVIARKNQLFDEILDVDEAMKAAAKADTPFGQRGFFFSSPLAAKRNLPNNEIVPIDDYIEEYFKDGTLINRLKGMYTTREIAEGFSNAHKVQNFMRGETGGTIGKTFSWAYRNLLLTPKAGSQYAKTILSIPTHFRNFFSAGAFAMANGIFFENPALWLRAMNRAKQTIQIGGIRKPEAMDRYRRYLELGVTNTNVRMGDIKNLMKDVKIGEGNIATDSILKPMIGSLGQAGKAIRKGARGMQEAYVAEDDFWKIGNFEIELERLTDVARKSGQKITPKLINQLEEEAAEIVRNTVPNYAYVGEFVRTMRVAPFGNFMSFPSEIFRTGTGVVTRALKEIADPKTGKINPITSTNPKKGIGMKRLIGGVAAFGAIPYGVIKGSQMMFGVSNEEADAGNSFVAPWAKTSQKLYFRDSETGEIYYVDWSKSNAYDTLTRPFQSVLYNIQKGIEDEEVLMKGFLKGLAEAAGETASPFVSESIFTEAFLDLVARGGRTREGRQLFTEQTPWPEVVQRILGHLAKTQLPTVAPFERTYKAARDIPGPGPELYEIPHEMAGIFGFRGIKLRPEKSLGFLIYDYQRGISEARKEFTGGPEGLLKGDIKTSKDVIERFFVANQGMFNVQKKMLKEIKDAQTLGVPEDKIYEIFEKRGLSKRIVDGLLSGEFKGYFPSEKIEERFEDIAAETGRPNPLLAAYPTLDAIIQAFENTSLYGEIDFNLADFLPGMFGGETGQVPLPSTPEVDARQVAQINQNITPTGLTHTENALLSNEEKAMRLRQRGQA